MNRLQEKALSGPQAVDEEHWMRRALALARRGEGRTRPNPPVGAVIVRDGVAIGEGFHRQAGGPHAEIGALRGLDRQQVEGATLYVTLEPCSTHGRTPPCTDAILRSGIARTVVSAKDPNPKHAGRGLRLLARHGIEVVTGACRAEGEALIAPFAKWVRTGRPFVTLKMGMTLDGRIADSDRCSRWITGERARREVRALRRRADAVLVGANTALQDNPSLRYSTAVAGVNPLRLILDGAGRVPLDSNVFTDGQSTNTVVVTTARCKEARRAAVEAAGARVWICGDGERIDLAALLDKAGAEGLLHVLCEGGGVLAEELVRLRLADAYWFFIAPRFLGGRGVPVLGGSGWPLADAPLLKLEEVRRVGGDVLIRAVPAEAV